MIMRLGGKKEFLYLTPKFDKLLNVLESNSKDRHIIYTSFDSYYGSDILHELLKEKFSIMVISSSLSESEKEKIINTWNKNKNYNVLIITTSVPVIPENVNHIHIIDTNMKEIYERIFEISEKKSETIPDLGESLVIHFHMSEKINPEDEKIIDEYTFPVFYEYLSSKKNFWDLVLEKSKGTYLKNNRVIINE
jgi:superfamily II DNA/RNA helicase